MESYFVVKSLANGAAVEICDTDITKYTKKEYDRIRDHLLHHQVVVIKNQTIIYHFRRINNLMDMVIMFQKNN